MLQKPLKTNKNNPSGRQPEKSEKRAKINEKIKYFLALILIHPTNKQKKEE